MIPSDVKKPRIPNASKQYGYRGFRATDFCESVDHKTNFRRFVGVQYNPEHAIRGSPRRTEP